VKRIVLAQQKGGAAKTTLCVHLAVAAERAGLKTAIGVRHGSMRQPAAVDAAATGDRTNGSDPQRQARGGAGVRPER
jgi:chromosome partitioning protein